jgi:hypothetical protein
MIGLASGLEIHHLPRGIARSRTTAERVPTALRRCCGRVERRVENGIWARHSFLARCVARAYSMPSAGTADAIPQVAARTAVLPLPRDRHWGTATAQSRGKGGGGGGGTSGDRHRQGDCRKSTPDSRPVPKAGTICADKRVLTPFPPHLFRPHFFRPLPLQGSDGVEVPSHQSYLCLPWLRDSGLIPKGGRQGYFVPRGLDLLVETSKARKNLPPKQ